MVKLNAFLIQVNITANIKPHKSCCFSLTKSLSSNNLTWLFSLFHLFLWFQVPLILSHSIYQFHFHGYNSDCGRFKSDQNSLQVPPLTSGVKLSTPWIWASLWFTVDYKMLQKSSCMSSESKYQETSDTSALSQYLCHFCLLNIPGPASCKMRGNTRWTIPPQPS